MSIRPIVSGVLLVAAILILLGAGAMFWFQHATPRQYARIFNYIYLHPRGSFTREPNRLLVETVTPLAPGRALDIAMGEGRNAVYLAGKGWDVTGFDVSDEALRQAREHAARAGVQIRAVQATSEGFDYGTNRWDLIVLSYAFAPVEDAAYVRRLHEALKPGGLIVYEHYVRAAFRRIPGVVGSGELPRLFAGFTILRYEEQETRGDWSYREKALLARLIARK